MSAPPSISVILACKNPGSRLAAAVESLLEQRQVAAELIVVDGASTDGTRAWLEARRDRFASFVSEPDDGLFAALNKGIAAARGEWIHFFGADDRIAGDRVLSETVNWMRKTEAGVVVGDAAFDDGRIAKMPERVNAIAGNFAPRHATFYRRALFEENGVFDVSLPRHADYELNLRLWKSHVRFKSIRVRIAACGVGGFGEPGGLPWAREEIAVRRRYFSRLRCLPWDLLSLARGMRKPNRTRPPRPARA